MERSRLFVTTRDYVVIEGEPVKIEPGYRVACDTDDDHFFFLTTANDRMCYKREQDAKLAKAALEREGLADMEKLKAAGWERVKKICLEAMQW